MVSQATFELYSQSLINQRFNMKLATALAIATATAVVDAFPEAKSGATKVLKKWRKSGILRGLRV